MLRVEGTSSRSKPWSGLVGSRQQNVDFPEGNKFCFILHPQGTGGRVGLVKKGISFLPGLQGGLRNVFVTLSRIKGFRSLWG